MRRIVVFVACGFWLLSVHPVRAAPCYGTRMPGKNKFFTGLATHWIFKSGLKQGFGEVSTSQNFWLISYGVWDRISLDLKGGAGTIQQHPLLGEDPDYPGGFAGGYGLRFKIYQREALRAVFGFQHISVHPKSIRINNIKHVGIVDDWQVSLLGSIEIKRFTPYLGVKWDRVDYIQWLEEDRKRQMGELSRTFGMVIGTDISLSDKVWLNLEGQFIDTQAVAASINMAF